MSESGSGSVADAGSVASKLTFEELSELNERKAELRRESNEWVASHPELKSVMSDFMAALMQRKPDDVFAFAAEYFEAIAKAGAADAEAAAAAAEGGAAGGEG
eukprot:CAMPEP_0203815622 /NCGR_PEP_ID=MMETSP0115-20131106/11213_1 /ASSEMBLY_ACC=CAM_ASM_000227 /TAXON_ID=33651 /ORGANISM="Bicosoecid sp, Strain ms1" /LENGTH=102 /DNA_ID=CAMNT_0050724521 /DNA_START=137 /DNA_END=442 /DNA_ORIENTATION=+